MKPSIAFGQHRDTIRRIVASHRASHPRVFGSVLLGTVVLKSCCFWLIGQIVWSAHLTGV